MQHVLVGTILQLWVAGASDPYHGNGLLVRDVSNDEREVFVGKSRTEWIPRIILMERDIHGGRSLSSGKDTNGRIRIHLH